MIRYRYKGAQLLFVGINPHQGSFDRGVPFSNNKMFWYLLAKAGLLAEHQDKLKDDAYLQTVYRKWFNAARGLGFVNLIDRPTRDITLLFKAEELPGKARVKRIITAQRPKVVCFIGKGVRKIYRIKELHLWLAEEYLRLSGIRHALSAAWSGRCTRSRVEDRRKGCRTFASDVTQHHAGWEEVRSN